MEKDPSLPANVRLNEDAALVARIEKGLEMRGGHCPCRLQLVPRLVRVCFR